MSRKKLWYSIIVVCAVVAVNEYGSLPNSDSGAVVPHSPVAVPEPAQVAKQEEPAQEPCQSTGQVINPTFSSNIRNRLPHTLLVNLTDHIEKVFFFFELIGSSEEDVKLRWFKNEQPTFEEDLAVGGLRWRIWSEYPFELASGNKIDVEVWSNECLVYSHSAIVKPSSEAESAPLMDDSVAFYASSQNPDLVIDMLYRHMHEARFDDRSPVYAFTSSGHIVVDGTVARDPSTRDAFTQAIERNAHLPNSRYSKSALDRRTSLGDTVLTEAIKYGSFETARSALNLGASPFLRDREGRSPLDLAAQKGTPELSAFIVQHIATQAKVGARSMMEHADYFTLEVDSTARNRLGETLLMRAAAAGNEAAIFTLTALPADTLDPAVSPYYLDYAGRSALDIALEADYPGAVLLLERAVAENLPPWVIQRSVMASKVEGDVPTNCSIQDADEVALVVDMLDMFGREIQIRWLRGVGPVETVKEDHFQIYRLQQRLVSRLDTTGFSEGERFSAEIWSAGRRIPLPGANRVFTRRTSSHKYDCKKNFKHDKSFLSHSFQAWLPMDTLGQRVEGDIGDFIDINWRSDLYQDILRTESHIAMQFLLSRGATLDFSMSGGTMARGAVMGDRFAVLSLLLAKGFDLSSVSKLEREQRSLIKDATYYSSADMVRFLHRRGLPVDELTSEGLTPLATALSKCDPELTEVLIDLGADLDFMMPAKHGRPTQSIREYGAKCSYDEKIKALLSR